MKDEILLELDPTLVDALTPHEARYVANTYDFLARHDGRQAFHSISIA